MKILTKVDFENNKIWYKLIQLKSIRTLETINVGIVYILDKEHTSVSFKIFEDVGYIEESFPIFKNQDMKICASMLNVKLKLNMIDTNEIKITRNINISETKVYISKSNDIENEIFDRYITIETTKKYFLPLYQKYRELIDQKSRRVARQLSTGKTNNIKQISLKNTKSDIFTYIKRHRMEKVL